jgi:uncharacterized protein YcfJ
MWRKSLVFGTALSMVVFAAAAQADHDRRGRDRGDDVDYARVIDVEPIVRRVRVTTPRRECWDEVRYDDDRYYGGRRDRHSADSNAGGMIMGGIIGGVIGSTIGRGDGRRVATAAGALIGSAIGHDAAQRRRSERYGHGGDEGRTVERCDIREEESWEERVDGYDVTYEYAGRRYHTRLPYDPGDRMRVEVAVRPG